MELQILNFVNGLGPVTQYILMGLGSLVILGQAYVIISPSEKDDAWFAKLENIPVLGGILKAIKSFSPIQRKK